MSNIETEAIIEDAVNDAAVPEEVPEVADETPEVEATEAAVVDTGEVKSPGSTDEPVEDEFSKKFGLQPQSVTGRENRIPYSRVKKIVERNTRETEARLRKELDVSPKITEYETKVRDYEGRLERVAQFEHILENDPKQFLQMLSGVPAYKEFFDYLTQVGKGGSTEPKSESYFDNASMPQPDQTLSDGSTVYSMEGLARRDEWLARQIEDKVIKQTEARLSRRYAPIEQDYQAQQRIAAAVPVVQQQISDARTWPMFTDNEPAIVAALQANQKLSLEGAYRQVVYPKLQTNRDEMRKSILEEIKKKPTSTSVVGSASRPRQVGAGKRSLEEIIAEQAATLK